MSNKELIKLLDANTASIKARMVILQELNDYLEREIGDSAVKEAQKIINKPLRLWWQFWK